MPGDAVGPCRWQPPWFPSSRSPTCRTFPAAQSLRSQLAALAEALEPHETGVLITLDEVHTAALEDLRTITHAAQLAFREERDVAFVVAGLPIAVEDVLNDDVMTFLRRAERFALGGMPRGAVERALRMPITTGGRQITPEALDIAVEGTRGYPFMVQLVGHQAWNVERDSEMISEEQAYIGVERAASRVGSLIHRPALSATSPVDRSFLVAMSADSGPSTMSQIASRLGVARNYANQYRRRLIAAGLVSEAGRGLVEFSLPYLREYLHEQSAVATRNPIHLHQPRAAPARRPVNTQDPREIEQALAATRNPFGATLPGRDGPQPGR